MAIDMRRPLIAAIEAALDEINSDPPSKKRKGGTGRALLVGAGLVTAGRLAMSSRGRNLLESLQDRLPEAAPRGEEDDESRDGDPEFDENEEPEAEEDEDFEEAPEEDEDLEDEPEDEPQGEEDEDLEDEPEDEPVAEDEGAEAAGDEAEDEEEPEPEPAPKRRSRSRATSKSRR